MVRYWSDRVPEVTGRGGFLLHPWVEGLAGQHQILTWPMGKWDKLADLIDRYLADDHARETVAAATHSETIRRHTYTVRMAQVLEAVCLS
jgi:spore maturation protein CgeB